MRYYPSAAMSQVSEATARYHKLIESEPYIDLAWAEALQARLRAEKLVSRPLSPVLRPHFLTTRDYAILGRARRPRYSPPSIAPKKMITMATPRAALAHAVASRRAHARLGRAGLLAANARRIAGCESAQRQHAFRRAPLGRAFERSLRRPARRHLFRRPAGQGLPQETQAHQTRQHEGPDRGDTQGLQGIRRQEQEDG